jgi:hypothetical protein
MHDESTSDWVVGLMMAVFGLIGLIMAGGARDNEIFIFGLSLLGFAVIFIGGLVRSHYDTRDLAAAKARNHG